ncbi:hypothetical protein, partial [Staphylococcus aureus]
MKFLRVLPILSILVLASASTPLSAATETGSTKQPLAKSVASTVQPADQAIAQDTTPVKGLKATINEIPTQLVMDLF